METGQNSRAVVCVAAYHNFSKALFSLRSAEKFLPGFDLYMVVLDMPENSSSQEGSIAVLPAAGLFALEEEFYNQAFFCTEEEFTQVVTCKAALHFFARYQTVAMVEAGAVLCGPIMGLWGMLLPDTVLSFEWKPDYGEYPPVWLLSQNIYTNGAGLAFYSNGQRMQKALQWCLRKFGYIRQQAFSSCKDTARTGEIPDAQSAFYASWQAFFSLFGCQYKPLPGQAVVLPAHGPDTQTPALVNFARLKDNEPLSAKQPMLAQMAADYKMALAGLPKLASRYQFDYFEDGTPLFPLLRPYLYNNYRLRFAAGGNPFQHRALFTEQSMILGEEGGLPITAVTEAVWQVRPDLQRAFPQYRTEQRLPFIGWFLQNGTREYKLPEVYTSFLREPYRLALQQEEEHRLQLAKAKTLPARVARRLGQIFGFSQRNKKPVALPEYPQGVNLCAYIRGDFGIAEGGRILADILDAAGIPFTIIDIEGERTFHYSATRWNHKITNTFLYNTNLMFTNADGMANFMGDVAPSVFEGRCNIGYWAWELPEFPEQWRSAFALLQEVWAPSQFAADSIATKSPVPVRSIPHSVVVELPPKELTRADFGLPETPFLFLMMYDVRSKAARKNPEGAVEAFLKAFEGDERAALLIKINAPEDWDGEDELLQQLERHRNIYTLNRTLTRMEVNGLLNCSDAYVSLHRSEGFGLAPAEAMYLGKPVVLTNWSGNTEYMTPENCCPVSYKIVEIEKDHGPYKKGFHWAQPDTDSAAEQMKRLVEDPEWRAMIAANGQKTIWEEFSPQAIGRKVRARLEELGQMDALEEPATEITEPAGKEEAE